MTREVPTRASYRHFERIDTRWGDNDLYGHINNVVYYAYFDTVINRVLIAAGGLDPHAGGAIGLCVESGCQYTAPASYPDALEGALRVARLGRTSVRYELGIFRAGTDTLCAHGHFVHVFVDRETRRPTPIPDRIREALETLG